CDMELHLIGEPRSFMACGRSTLSVLSRGDETDDLQLRDARIGPDGADASGGRRGGGRSVLDSDPNCSGRYEERERPCIRQAGVVLPVIASSPQGGLILFEPRYSARFFVAGLAPETH